MLVAGESGVDVFLKKDKLQLMIIASDLAAERQTSWQQKAAENEIDFDFSCVFCAVSFWETAGFGCGF